MVIWRRNENFGFLKKKKNKKPYTDILCVFVLIPGVGYGLLGHDLPSDLVGVGE